VQAGWLYLKNQNYSFLASLHKNILFLNAYSFFSELFMHYIKTKTCKYKQQDIFTLIGFFIYKKFALQILNYSDLGNENYKFNC
jgi:hypothetical protein